ncbi:hypothetical protein ACFLV3_00320 [Chloroflexota bacterium]
MLQRFKQHLTLVDIDKKLAVFLAGVGVIMLVITVTVFASLAAQQVSVTLLLASGVYLLLRKRRKSNLSEKNIIGAPSAPSSLQLHPRSSRLLSITFWALFTVCLIILSQHAYARPLSFLILVSIMSSILAIEIFTGKNTAYCLIKVLIIAMILRASAWYQFPSPIGSDSIVEVDFLQQLVATGHTGAYLSSYIHYSVAYFLAASAALITGFGTKDAFFILGVVEVISLLFLFLIGRDIFDKKIGLLAILIMAVFDWHVYWGFWLKAMSFGIALLPILLFFLIVRPGIMKKRMFFTIGSILLIGLIILNHPGSAAIILAVIVIGWLSALVCRRLQAEGEFEQVIQFNIVLLFFVSIFSYWLYVSSTINYVGFAIKYALSIDAPHAMMFTLPRGIEVMIWQSLPILILVFFTILGCLSIFNINNAKIDQKTLLQVWIALVSGGIVITSFILFWIPALGALESLRWYVFMGLIIAMPAAKGITSILSQKGWRNLAVLFLLTLLLSGIMTTSRFANVALVIPWEHQIRNGLTSSEMAAAETVSQIAEIRTGQFSSTDTIIYADTYYTQEFLYELDLPPDGIADATPIYNEKFKEYHGILMLRTAVTEEVVTARFEGGREQFKMEQAKYQAFIDDPQACLIYNNGVVQALERP